MLAALITLVQRSVSTALRFAASSAVPPSGPVGAEPRCRIGRIRSVLREYCDLHPFTRDGAAHGACMPVSRLLLFAVAGCSHCLAGSCRQYIDRPVRRIAFNAVTPSR